MGVNLLTLLENFTISILKAIGATEATELTRPFDSIEDYTISNLKAIGATEATELNRPFDFFEELYNFKSEGNWRN